MPLGILNRAWWRVKRVLGLLPPIPRCEDCGDQLLLEMEVEQGKCVDCQQPAVVRNGPRPLGKASTR